MAVNELQRQSYLQTMGVDIFVPRFILPAAKMTERCELPQVESAPVPEHIQGQQRQQEQTQQTQGQAPNRPQDKPPVENHTFVPVFADDSVQENVTIPARVTSEKAPQFQLLFACYASELVFVLPSPSGQLSVDQQRLLYDIAFSVTGSATAQGGQWRYELFRWPLQKGKQLEQGEDAARQTLQGFVHRFAGSTMIMMGQLSGRFLCSDKTLEINDAGGREKSAQLYFPHDLNEIMARPALKKQLWQQLQMLQLQISKSHH